MVGKRVAELDGLRALAALAVFSWHAGFTFGGPLGVDVFFVLSGFLITGIIVRAAESFDYWAFMNRRMLRLFPALAVMVVVYVIVSPPTMADEAMYRWPDAGAALFYFTDLVRPFTEHVGPIVHTWSLAVEVQFYLVFPPLVLWLVQRHAKRAALILICAWAILTGIRFTVGLGLHSPRIADLSPLHSTGLFLGAAMALIRWRASLGGIGLALLIGLMIGCPLDYDIRTLAAPVAEIAAAMTIMSPPAILARGAWLGRISYSFYLWHLPLLDAAWHRLGPPPNLFAVALVLPLSIVLAAISYRFLERPFQGARKTSAPSIQAKRSARREVTTAIEKDGDGVDGAGVVPHAIDLKIADLAAAHANQEGG